METYTYIRILAKVIGQSLVTAIAVKTNEYIYIMEKYIYTLWRHNIKILYYLYVYSRPYAKIYMHYIFIYIPKFLYITLYISYI